MSADDDAVAVVAAAAAEGAAVHSVADAGEPGIAIGAGRDRVSTQALQVFWDFLAAHGRSRDPVLAELAALGVQRETLLRRGGWISYGAFVAAERAVARVFPQRVGLFEEIGRSVAGTGGLGFLRTLSRSLLSPRFVYRRMPGLMHAFLFRFFELRFEQVAWNRLRGVYTFEPECPPTDAFLETARGVLAGVPVMLGAPAAEVTLRRVGPLHVEVELRLDQWHGPLHFLRRMGAGLLRAVGLGVVASREAARELEETNRLLQEQVAELDASRETLAEKVRDLESLRTHLADLVEARTEALQETQRALLASVARLESSDRAKTDFFTNVSHEFKTPLTLILATVEDLERKGLPPERAAGAVRRHALNLLDLINEILDFSRLDAERMPVRPSRFDVGAVLASVVADLTPLAQAREVTVTLRPEAAPCELLADRTLVARAALNLVANGIKYCRPGDHVEVSLSPGSDTLAIRVADNGPGIASDQQARIFERFARSSDADGRLIEGSGIGLAMVSEIASLHGGTLELVSAPGAGAAFTLHLPQTSPPSTVRDDVASDAAVAEAPDDYDDRAALVALAASASRTRHGDAEALAFAGHAAGPAQGEGDNADAAGLAPALRGRVLVVDDNPELRAWMARLLGERHHVWIASDGAEALAMVREHGPDVVVSDVMMPVMDGHELARRIKGDSALARAAVILVTARHGTAALVAGFAALADDFIAKPFAADELLLRVQTQLRLRHLSMALIRSEKRQLLGALSSGMAHEVLNPVNALLQSTRLLRADNEAVADDDRLGDDDRVALLGAIERGGERIQNIVRAVQSFARHDAERGRPQPVSLAERVEALLPLLQHRLNAAVRVETDIALTAPLVVHGDLLDQLLLNLLLNGLDAVGSAGVVRLHAAERDGVIEVSVEDSGAGVPEATRGRVFEPFFTTKDPGKGTGMGLAIAMEVADLHGGSLTLAPAEPGRGARFVARLPLYAPDART